MTLVKDEGALIMALQPSEKKEIISKYGASASDTGSPEAQVALLVQLDRLDEFDQVPLPGPGGVM